MSLTIVNSDNVFQKDVIGNVRTAQEDSHDIAILTPNGDVFVVCDGMGGHVGGKQASSIAVKSIIEYLKKEKYASPLQALNDALQFANMQILGYVKEHPELRGMGTTACIVLLQEKEAYIAHVGDSRIYLYLGKEQELHRVTKDHSFVQTLVDIGQITDEEAEHHPNKNRILKALGIKLELQPTCNVLHPKNGDCFLICSDGLNGMISDTTIRGILTQNLPLAVKGEQLIQGALDAGGHDNITVELIQISSSPHSQSKFESYNPHKGPTSPYPNAKNSPFNSSKIKKIIIWTVAIVISMLIGFVVIGMVLDASKTDSKEHSPKSHSTSVNNPIDLEISKCQEELKILENSLEDLQKRLKWATELNDVDSINIKSINKYNNEIDSINKLKEKLSMKINSLNDARNKESKK